MPGRKGVKLRAPSNTCVAVRRVSTSEQGDSGAGLDAQTAAIEAWAKAHGKEIVDWYEDVASGSSMDKRPGLAKALKDVREKRAATLVVAKLDRLTRSLLDFANIVQTAQKEDWNLVALDLGVDLSTPTGQLLAGIMALFAQWERQMIGQRTRDGLAAKRAQGVRLGRPSSISENTVRWVLDMEAEGFGPTKIANDLNLKRINTAQGGKQWYPQTVKQLLTSQLANKLRAIEQEEREPAPRHITDVAETEWANVDPLPAEEKLLDTVYAGKFHDGRKLYLSIFLLRDEIDFDYRSAKICASVRAHRVAVPDLEGSGPVVKDKAALLPLGPLVPDLVEFLRVWNACEAAEGGVLPEGAEEFLRALSLRLRRAQRAQPGKAART